VKEPGGNKLTSSNNGHEFLRLSSQLSPRLIGLKSSNEIDFFHRWFLCVSRSFNSALKWLLNTPLRPEESRAPVLKEKQIASLVSASINEMLN
jgi:hypothetical protein